MNSIVKHGLLVSLALAGVACGSGGGSTGPAAPPKPVTLELDTWWTTASDLAGIQAVTAIHQKAHPNVTVNVVSAASQGEMDTAVTNRFTNGNPPAALQANPGGNALQFGASALALNPKWTSGFNPAVLGQLTVGGKLIGVPLGLTRQNNAYWNLKVLNTLPSGLNTVPVGLDAFKTWVVGAAAAGYTHPLCMGFKSGWVNAHILFEDLLPAMAGADYSVSYWSGKMTDPQPLSDALDFAATYIFPYLTTDTSTLTSVTGTDRLMAPQTDPSQQCIMTAMGDWGGAQLQAAPDNFVLGTDFYATGFPGAENLVDFAGDAMVAAQGTGDEADILALFDTMASADAQVAFATGKKEMPARIDLTDAQLASLPPLVQTNLKALKVAALPGYKIVGKAAYDFAGISTQSQAFFLSGDKTAIVAFMASNYAKLM
jgi:ABC-type glycerol-3-phosphate transport system substrate-binding protein